MVRIKEIELNPKNIIQQEPRIISCQVSQGKLITQLTDGREVSVSVDLLIKYGILDDDINPKQLKKYELQNEGRYIYFPEIDDILPVRIISEGLFKSCWER